ncbi:hypothetical protein T4B_11256 [Trichinella pseudospiralis]|uniref:Uncharacterized protein n=1 Tax=Trichinella pseudospiralis TaxID=6337 RepID=A0A0V1J198_TRIPS|nr:hypothetical protein T4B_11256 [Trichinella pseudospiralis]
MEYRLTYYARAKEYLKKKTEPVEMKEITTSLAMAKLSTWNFPKFSRNVFELASFVEQFRVAIHNKIELDDLTKFVYLRSLLEGEGLKSIKGIARLQCERWRNRRNNIQALLDKRSNEDRKLHNTR